MSKPVQLLCTLSGGFDSVAALLLSLTQAPTRALFIDYLQPYKLAELEALRYVVDECPAVVQHPNWRGYDVVPVPLKGAGAGNPWIPYRNLVIASVATNWAIGLGASGVVFGSKSTEHRPDDPISYLDSTVQFYDAVNRLLVQFAEVQQQVRVPRFLLPVLGWRKKVVLQFLQASGVDLRRLWNCYREDGGMQPCMTCPHCEETQPLIAEVLSAPTDR